MIASDSEPIFLAIIAAIPMITIPASNTPLYPETLP